jgi:hypothetical protein
VHVALPFALVTLPAAHVLGAVAPLAHDEPAGHAAQSPCDAPPVAPRKEPASHSITVLAPAPHQPPASHTSHAVALDDDWYSPASHSRQALIPLTLATEPGAQVIGSLERARQ